jgi:hypothetical protein
MPMAVTSSVRRVGTTVFAVNRSQKPAERPGLEPESTIAMVLKSGRALIKRSAMAAQTLVRSVPIGIQGAAPETGIRARRLASRQRAPHDLKILRW